MARAALLGFAAVLGCDGDKPGSVQDPHIVPRPDLREDPGFISPPILQFPIYACAQSVVVRGFIPGAKLEVFVNGIPAPVGSTQSWLSAGQNIMVTPAFTMGQVVTATQSFDGATSGPSNAVTVTSHTEDYPAGLPAPRLGVPCLECGKALGIGDAVPGALVRVVAANPLGGGTYAPAVEVGTVRDFPYTFINPQFVANALVSATQELCTDVSPPSATATVLPAPPSVPTPSLDPVHEGVNIAVVWGPAGPGDPLLNGASLEVLTDPGLVRVGGQPTPGGGQQVYINPPASTSNKYRATQALCVSSPPSTPIDVIPCAQQPPATIRPPLPGDVQIELLNYIPGARILVFADGVEIGDGGGPVVQLSRPVAQGETIVVLQRIGTCDSQQVYQIPVDCSLGGDASACSADWPAFRHNGLRNASQPIASALSNPYLVKKLGVTQRFPRTGTVGGFIRGSVVVSGGRVFAASSDGHVYALDAVTLNELWRYPPSGAPALTTTYTGLANSSSLGVAASPVIATISDRGEAVIFGAPDRSIGAGLGSGRLFALRTSNGAELWKSPELARLTGTTDGNTNELHEQFGYSSPLVMGDKVYVGIADHADGPIQIGRVVAVNLSDGTPVAGFSFNAAQAGKRGGGIWGSVAGGLGGGLYATTGNSRQWNFGSQSEPNPNHGLSMLRLDPATGVLAWKLQPVSFDADDDPDWASGASLLASSCGDLVMSTMKDGWSYAAHATSGSAAANVRWQFPPTGWPFHAGDGTTHGDTRYLEPGAAWHDIFFSMTGGYEVELGTGWGFGRLHALNTCAGHGARVRWTVDLGPVPGGDYQLGPPTVTRGIVYIGTAAGELVAIADPSVWPAQGSRCSRPEVAGDCVANGYALVPVPTVLTRIPLGGGTVRTEPVLAGGRVYVGTGNGIVFLLEPGP